MHIEILRGLAIAYGRKGRYLEIGVGDGGCFGQVARECKTAVAVDVPDNPYGNGPANLVAGLMRHCHFFDCGSDEFFERWAERPMEHRQFELIFIDGSHWEEQVEIDFTNALSFLAPNGTIAMHDTWAATAEEARDGSDTAYKVAARLEKMPWFQVYTLPIRPGLTLVRPNVVRSYS